jgi:hypothetical protein
MSSPTIDPKRKQSLSHNVLSSVALLVVAALLPLVIGSACNSGCSSYVYRERSSSQPGQASEAGTAETTPYAAPIDYWFANLWLYTNTAMTESVCTKATSLANSGRLFAAVRFPTQGLVSGSTVRSPIVYTNYFAPRFALLEYKPNPQEILTAKGEQAPERLDWIRANLPQVAGTEWDALRLNKPSIPSCPAGLSIAADKWELFTAISLDYGSGTACNGCVLDYYLCYEGQDSPFSLAARAANALGVVKTVNADGITCAGPTPFRLVDTTAPPSPSFSLVGGNTARSDSAPVRIEFHHMIENSSTTSTYNVTLGAVSSNGLTWKLYETGTNAKPDYFKPITGPLYVGQGGIMFWAVCDVPAGFKGLETLKVTATASSAPTSPVSTSSYVLVGPWIPPTPTYHHYWLQVASHATGANQSQWRTDLGLLNPGTSNATVELRYHAPSGVLTRTQAVGRGQQVIVQDVVDAFAPASGSTVHSLVTATGSAALEVVSTQPLKVSSRTYNLVASNAACYPSGTFGQNYNAFVTEDGISAQQSAYLPQLVENAAYRTNIALTNTGSTPASVTVDLFDGAGRKVGTYDVSLAAGQYKQENRPFFFKAGGQTNLSQGWAWVQVRSGSGILASASVVDNKTNDPTTLPALRRAATRSWIQVASHALGANQSQWRTDLGLLNVDTTPLRVQVRFHTSGGVKTNALSVAAGQQAILVDVVNQIPSTGSAALEVSADRPVWVSSRTYNLVAPNAACYPTGTFGQSYDAYLASTTLGNGATAYLTQLQENAAYRTNIALTNTGTVPARVTVILYNGAGTQVGQYNVDLTAGQYKQENKPFATKAGLTNMAAGYAKVEVVEGGGIIASASVVDNLTNDPTTMPAL